MSFIGEILTQLALEAFVLPGDKTLVVNSATFGSQVTYQLVRYLPNGTLDATYGNGGIAALVIPGLPNARFTKAVRQPDGKIILTGYVDNDSLVARFNEDATLDATFASGGFTRPNFNPNNADRIDGVALQPDGKIVVASTIYSFGYSLYLVRYLPNGTLDATFGGGGIINHSIVVENYAFTVEDIFLQSNGKILTKGFDVRRFNADGSADNSFNILQIGGSSDFSRTRIIVQPDDKFVLARRVSKTATLERAGDDISVTRYNANGSLDVGFGLIGGNTDIDVANFFNDEPLALAIQPDGQILVGITTFVQPNRNRTRNWTLALARLSPTGAINGKFFVTQAYPSYDAFIKILPDGKILTVFLTYSANFASADLLLTRSLGVPLAGYNFLGVPFDFNLDGKTEPSVFRPDTSKWYFFPDASNGYEFGIAGDVLAPSDYIGTLAVDLAVFRPSNGTWYIFNSAAFPPNNIISVRFGQAGDIPVPADYDGDGKSDVAVFRPSNGGWYIRNSADNSLTSYLFGQSGDKPAQGDYDGDGRADIGVYRPSSGTWYTQRSTGGFLGVRFGTSGDVPVAEDYDGDGKFDIAVFRPSNGVWYRINSADGSFAGVAWGLSTDAPVPADYDGDSKIDVAVFRPSENRWYVLRSADGAAQIYLWGTTADVPLPRKQ